MKYFLTVALAVFSLCGLNAQAKPAKAPARAAAAAVPAPVAEFNKSLDNFEGMGKTLAGIHDRASADAAVPKLRAYKDKLDNGEADIDEAMECLSDDEQKATVARLLSLINDVDKQMQRLEKEAYYGSPTLSEFLTVDLAAELN